LWKGCKKEIFRLATSTDINTLSQIDIEEIDKMIQQNKAPCERRARTKFNHAQTFVEYFAQWHSSLSPNPGEEDLRVLPYETISQLFEEYESMNKIESVHPDFRAARTTFREAWKDLYHAGNLRFTRGKGTFPTCDVCNNCNDLLQTAKSIKWTRKQREIIFSFKSMHLKQQAAERAALDALKKLARESCDDAGQPKLACFLGDGMTIYACQTPKYSRSRISKGDTHFFQNRTFGVEVHCYGVSGTILIHSDELIRGGANYIIEVQRICLRELGQMLKAQNKTMPKEIHFQWDNCGEQKNKEYFMYCSLLVEIGAFDKITVGFLMVGHTHCSIYRSVFFLLKKANKESTFYRFTTCVASSFWFETKRIR
jgi:hypothetical protein